MAKVLLALDEHCAFFQWSYDLLDPKWGRPKDGTTLVDKIREAAELDNVKMNIGTRLDERDGKVHISLSTSGVDRFARGLSNERMFEAVARPG